MIGKTVFILVLAAVFSIYVYNETKICIGSMPLDEVDPVSSCEEYAKSNQTTLLEYWKENHKTPSEYIISKFAENNWVFIGEYHRIKHDVELISDLIPLLHEHTDVRCLASEFLCWEYTDEANNLIMSDEYNRRAVIDLMKKQDVNWPYEEYLAIYRSTWESNQKHAKDRGPFRFVGLSPALDWELINYGDDEELVRKELEKRNKIDEIMAETLEGMVLRSKIKALIYTGIAHSTAKFIEYWYNQPGVQLSRMGNLVFKEPYKKNMFFICLHATFYDSSSGKDIYPFDGVLDKLMVSFGKNIGFDVVNTPFAGLKHKKKGEYAITQYAFEELYDGYVIFKTPIKEYVGVTKIKNWIRTEEEYRQYCRNIPNKEASSKLSDLTFEEFIKFYNTPSTEHGEGFKRRFRKLQEISEL